MCVFAAFAFLGFEVVFARSYGNIQNRDSISSLRENREETKSKVIRQEENEHVHVRIRLPCRIVRAHMCRQRRPSRECLLAERVLALVWSLPRVRSPMSSK